MVVSSRSGGVVNTLLKNETNPPAKVTIEGKTYDMSGGILLVALSEAARAAELAKANWNKNKGGQFGGRAAIPSGSIYGGARAARTKRPASGAVRQAKVGSKPIVRKPTTSTASTSIKKGANKASLKKPESGKKSTKAELKGEMDNLVASMPEAPRAGKEDAKVLAKATVVIEGKKLSTFDTIRYFNSWVAWLSRGVLDFIKNKVSMAVQNPMAAAASLTAFAVFNERRFLICPGGCNEAFNHVSESFTHVTEPMFNALLGPVCHIFGFGIMNPFSPLLGTLAAVIAGLVAVATVIVLGLFVRSCAWHGTKLVLKFVGTTFSTLKEKTIAWWRGEAKKEMTEDVKDIEKTVEYGKKSGLSALRAKTDGSDWQMLGFDPSQWHATKKVSEGYDKFSNWLTGKDTTKQLTPEEKKAEEASENSAKALAGLGTTLALGKYITPITHNLTHSIRDHLHGFGGRKRTPSTSTLSQKEAVALARRANLVTFGFDAASRYWLGAGRYCRSTHK